MTIWDDNRVEQAVRAALDEVHLAETTREHFGVPYITAYQLAIKVLRHRPELADHFGPVVGGEGIDRSDTLAQYLARELSRRIQEATANGRNFGIEAALLSNVHVSSMIFNQPDAEPIRSSNASSGLDLAMFRRT